MENFILFNLLFHFYLCVVNVSSIYIERNAYKGITISISESVNEKEFKIEKLKKVLTKSSDFIYHATRHRSYFGEFVISFPSSWSGHKCKETEYTTEVSQKIDIHLTNSAQDPRLTTKHSRGCGFKGDRIDMPLGWLNKNFDDESLAHQFVQQWSIYRYGVFEETPIREDSCYASGTSWKPVGCYNIQSPSEPTFEKGLPVCSLPSDFFEKKELRSSLMFAANSSKMLDFCGGSSSFPHNPAMPTLHNTLCKGRTVWSVIENSPDFRYGRNLPLKAKKPPKTPTFKCFREEQVHVTFAIQTNTVKNLSIEVMTQIGSTMFEFLSNLAPKDSKVTLVTFSDEKDETKPLDLDMKNRTELHKDLQNSLRIATSINKVCLSCGLQKALNVTEFSSSSFPIVVVIAWKSAIVGENPGLVESIRNYPNRTTLHLALVEDTAAEDIPTEIIQAVRTLGGLIYSLPQELVFRSSRLLVILSAVVKKPLQLEDRIVVVHEKIYRDINKDFVDSFMTPPGDFSKMLYAIYCSPKDDSIIKSENEKCTSLSAASSSDTTFKCGEIWDSSIKKEPNTKWEYPFSYKKFLYPLHCSSIALLLTSPSASMKNSFAVKGWLSEYLVKVPEHAVIIYGEITGSPESEFNVMAQISGPGMKSPISLELRDNGNGDPDTKAGDGIYSRYFTEFSKKGVYTVSISAEMSTSSVKSFSAGNAKQEGKPVQSKTIGFFYVSDPVPVLDTLPPNRVADLRVESINHEERTALLQWTAPGGDYDSGKAKEYEVYYTEDWKDLEDSMLSKIQSNMLNSSQSPKPSGEPENITIQFPVQQEKSVYYVALTAMDITGNKGQLSNVVQIVIGAEKSPTTNITYFNITGDGTETSTDSIQKVIPEDDDFSRCYVILGGAIGVLLLIIIVNIIIWLVCFQKYKKHWKELQNNSQQSAAPMKGNADNKEKIPEDASTHPHSYTNPIMEQYSNVTIDSQRIRDTTPFHEPATYALVEKKERRNEERDGYPLRRVDNINIKPEYSRHRESDLGLV